MKKNRFIDPKTGLLETKDLRYSKNYTGNRSEIDYVKSSANASVVTSNTISIPKKNNEPQIKKLAIKPARTMLSIVKNPYGKIVDEIVIGGYRINDVDENKKDFLNASN